MPANDATTNESRSAFVHNLGECGLSASAKFVEVAEKKSGDLDGAALARELVDEEILTDFQAKAILERRFDDLRMGNYEILHKLGSGGMGTVFKARHRRMNRLVALKVLSKEVAGAEKFAQRFQREVETIALLAHPNIVMAFDADEAHAGPFLVMEFVDGLDLASDVHKFGPLSVADAVECTLQSARGLEYAHGQGIIHRDIKPGNIIRDSSGLLKVADLGLARLNDPDQGSRQSLTQAGGVLGTVDYMPPEQAVDSTAIDHTADIYSLGCTLYLLLTGHPPYTGSSIMGVLLKHRDAPIPSLIASRPDVPAELDAIFARMVAKLPGERFATMTDVAHALEELKRTTHLSDARKPKSSVEPRLIDNTIAFASVDASRDTSQLDGAAILPRTAMAEGVQVVLVEPSRTQAGIIRRYLEQLGITVVLTTAYGLETLIALKQHRIDAIVSAMHLTDMNGVQLATALVADPQFEHIGFVLATSESDGEAAAELPVKETIVVMPKPFDLLRLKQAISKATRQTVG